MADKVIYSEKELLEYLEVGFKDIRELAEVELDPSLLRLNLKIKGDNYNSSITPPVMRAILEMQEAIYRIYREYSGEKQLTQSKKLELDVVVKVEKGSSELLISFIEQFDLIKEAVKNMTGTQTLICFVATAVLFTTYKITGKAFDYLGKKKKMELELQKSKIDAEIKKEKNKEMVIYLQEVMNEKNNNTN